MPERAVVEFWSVLDGDGIGVSGGIADVVDDGHNVALDEGRLVADGIEVMQSVTKPARSC